MGASGRAGRELGGEQPGPVVAGHVLVAPALLPQPVHELPDGVVEGRRVLAHVQRREDQAERGHETDRVVHDPVRRERAAVLEQRVAHDEQVGEQLAEAA